MNSRWQRTDAPRGDLYDARWRSLAASGQNPHGEADLVDTLLRDSSGTRVLDAGCGTGRVAIELDQRGYAVVGVDSDARMLAEARIKAPDIAWVEADLTEVGVRLDAEFDLVVLAGNVMIFLDPGTEGRVLHELVAYLVPGALLVSGFQVRPDQLSLAEYDRLADATGLEPVDRWATWDREPFTNGGYAVSIHRKPLCPSINRR